MFFTGLWRRKRRLIEQRWHSHPTISTRIQMSLSICLATWKSALPLASGRSRISNPQSAVVLWHISCCSAKLHTLPWELPMHCTPRMTLTRKRSIKIVIPVMMLLPDPYAPAFPSTRRISLLPHLGHTLRFFIAALLSYFRKYI